MGKRALKVHLKWVKWQGKSCREALYYISAIWECLFLGREMGSVLHTDSEFCILCAIKSHPSGTRWDKTNTSECHANITARLASHPQQYFREAAFVALTQTQYGDSSNEVTDFSFFLNFKKEKITCNMSLTCWHVSDLPTKYQKTKEQNRLDQSFRCFLVIFYFSVAFSGKQNGNLGKLGCQTSWRSG